MEFQRRDLIQIDNLIKILNRGQYTLEGVEVIAMSDAMRWITSLQKCITLEIQEKEALQLLPPAPQSKEPEKPKKAKKAEQESKPVEPEKK